MKTHSPSRKFIYLIAFTFLLYLPEVYAQDEGIGTFSDLVGQARDTFPQPPTTRVIVMQKNIRGEMETVSETEKKPPFFSAPTVGLEYDYRLIQQKAPGGLTIDVNELHIPFSFNLASTKLAFEYVHIWADGSNNIGGSQSIDSNGVKLTLTQPIGDQLIFSLPLFYKNDDGDAVTSSGPQTFAMDTIAMNPLLIFSMPLATEKDKEGKPKPANEQPLTLSASSGYRLGATEKNDIHPISPDVDGWTGTFNLLAGAEYAPKDKDGYSVWKINGSVTWIHLTNFYLSKPVPRPDDNGFGLGATFVYNFSPFDSTGKRQPRWTIKIGYQYDGFNRDQYQHSVTAGGTYRFW